MGVRWQKANRTGGKYITSSERLPRSHQICQMRPWRLRYSNKYGLSLSYRVVFDFLGVIDKCGEDDDAENEEEDEQHELFGAGSESVDENLQPPIVLREFEQAQNTYHRQKLDDVLRCVLRQQSHHQSVQVEAQSGHQVNIVQGRFEEAQFRRTE